MDFRKVMYVVLIVVCVASIAIGVYSQVTKPVRSASTTNESTEILYEGKTQETLKKEFYDMFDNQIHIGDFDTSAINKGEADKEIVYTVFSLKEKKGDYDLDITFPKININNEIGNKFNQTTQEIFANKANEILAGNTDNTIYTVSYVGYINGDIMSIIISATLKEGVSPQRAVVQTYNYNLKTEQEVSIEDVLEAKGISMKELSNKVDVQIKEAIKQANEIQIAGYNVYKRDINDDMYKAENVSAFYVGEDGEIYIVYAYGNNGFTTEMDIIVV